MEKGKLQKKTIIYHLFLIFLCFDFTMAAAVTMVNAADQLLINPNFETSPLGTGWTFSEGGGAEHIKTEDGSVRPYSGNYMWHAGNNSESTVSQNVNLTALGYDAFRMNTGGYYVSYGGWDRSGGGDDVLISLMQRDNTADNGTSNLGWHSDTAWTHRTGTIRLTPGTDDLTFQVTADRDWGTNNNAYFDNAYLNLSEYDIWTWGDVSNAHWGTGNWNLGSSSIVIGQTGTGGLAITNGTALNSDIGNIGYNSGSNGFVIVDGQGSQWNLSGYLYVGQRGTGNLTIQDGGQVSSMFADIGYFSGSNGSVTVDGQGSQWNITRTLSVGQRGTGNLTIQNGGQVSSSSASIGYDSGDNGSVTVDGLGSQWNLSGYLYVGNSGTGNLAIQDGGQVSSGSASIGYRSGSNGSVTVDGQGSRGNISRLYVGDRGTGSLTIQNGGIVSSYSGYIGNDSGSNGSVTVDGQGSQWNLSGSLYVGNSGTGSLAIQNGGRVDVRNTLTINNNSRVNLDGGELRVRTLNAAAGIFNWNSGRLALLGNNTLGTTTVNSSSTLELGENVTLTMRSGASLFTLGSLELGGNNTLQLDNSQLLHTNQRLGLSGSRITGSGQIFVGSSGLDLGHGGALAGSGNGLDLWGDLYGSGSISNTAVHGDIYVGNSPGIMEMTDVDLSGTTLHMELAGNGGIPGIDYDQIIFNGEIDFTGIILELLISEEFTWDQYAEFFLFNLANATLTGEFAQIILPGLENGLTWDTSELYSTGKLSASSVPLPSGIWLLGLGILAIAGTRQLNTKSS